MTEVTISTWEFKACVDLANARLAVSTEAGLSRESLGPDQQGLLDRLQLDVLGACGELVVCKALNRFHSPTVNTFHNVADIGENIEARTTQQEGGSLIVRDNDPSDRYYFLVVGEPPTFRVAGWIKGVDAKQDQWLRNPGRGRKPAWFVPQNQLKQLRKDA
jgi:hypothetical protein